MIRVLQVLAVATLIVTVVAALVMWTFSESTVPTEPPASTSVVTTVRVQELPTRVVLYCTQATAPRGCVRGIR